MPGDLAPGVYVEEIDSSPPRIESVPTSIAVFVGAFQSGRFNKPVAIASVSDLERRFGDTSYESAAVVSQFFANGGQNCFVVRVRQRRRNANIVASIQAGLAALPQIDHFNLLCIPCTAGLETSSAAQIYTQAVALCQNRRAFLLIDPPATLQTPHDIMTWVDSNPTMRHADAALYYPWVRTLYATGSNQHRRLTPSGTMAGMISRTDVTQGLWKAPAGSHATLRDVVALDYLLSEREANQLTSRGVNCLREFPNVGRVVWGARTLSSDTEWKYVPVRRLALHVEESIERGLQWTVSEPNNEILWTNVRRNIEAFLFELWRAGALLGIKPEQAFFVKCDRTTMTQPDIENGNLIAHVGFAPLKPAEFVIFRFRSSALQS